MATIDQCMNSLLGTVLAGGVIIGLVALSAFFSSTEMAIFSLPTNWLEETDAVDDRRVQILQTIRANPHRLLVTILVGNNVVNVAISSITTVLLIRALPPESAVPVATIVVSFVILVFGEIVPKAYGLGQAQRWSLAVAYPLTLIERVLYPVVVFFDVITRWMTTALGGNPDIEEPLVES